MGILLCPYMNSDSLATYDLKYKAKSMFFVISQKTFKKDKTLCGMMEKCDCPAAAVCLYSNKHYYDLPGSID